jgi:hypothetical protein
MIRSFLATKPGTFKAAINTNYKLIFKILSAGEAKQPDMTKTCL